MYKHNYTGAVGERLQFSVAARSWGFKPKQRAPFLIIDNRGLGYIYMYLSEFLAAQALLVLTYKEYPVLPCRHMVRFTE